MNPLPTHLSRRTFIKSSAVAGAGLTLSLSMPATAQVSGPGKTGDAQASSTLAPNAFVRVTPQNQVQVVMKHFEMGQGSFTGLATLVAEELDADWSQVESVNAPADAGRYNNLFWGPTQGTGGSTAMANSFMQMREAGATVRYMLVQAAAKAWQVPADSLTVEAGRVHHKSSGRSLSFGDLADLAALEPVPEKVQLKTPDQFRLIGKTLPRKDQGKTTGSAMFTQDVQLPGMLTAIVAHAPRFGGKVKQVDAQKAESMPGVVAVLTIPSGVAVLADTYWQAQQAREALNITWDDSAALQQSSAEMLQEYHSLAAQPGTLAASRGDATAHLAQAKTKISADFEFPYLAHASMEPMNCVIQRQPEGAEMWFASQIPTLDQGAVASVLGLKLEQVKINVLFAGGSFGRRANPHSDYVVEAAEIAKAYGKAVPIKLIWSREDDTQAGYFRPLYVHRIKAGLDAEGNLSAWEQRIVGQSIVEGTAFSGLIKDGIDMTSVEGASNLPYRIPHFQVELTTVSNPVTVQWWRSVGSTHTAFSAETLLDDIAHVQGKDPVALRRELLQDHPRHLGVLELAANKAGWGNPLPEGHFRGVAVHESFNSYVAQVAEIARQPDGKYKVVKVTCAVDCGLAINPDVIKAQMEGGIGYGLSAALFSEITLTQGQVDQSNFHDYTVVRMRHMPAVDVYIVPSEAPPTGVGEPGTPPIAPAVANALFRATGKRIRRLPLGTEYFAV